MKQSDSEGKNRTLNVVCIFWPIDVSFETDSGRPLPPGDFLVPNRGGPAVKRVERYIMFSTN